MFHPGAQSPGVVCTASVGELCAQAMRRRLIATADSLWQLSPMQTARRVFLQLLLLLFLSANAQAVFGPDPIARTRWNGVKDTFWLKRVPPEFDKVREQFRLLNEAEYAERNGGASAEVSTRAAAAAELLLGDEA